MENKLRFKDLTIISMVISFAVLATTGILKFKKVISFLSNVYSTLPLAKITTYHEYSALALVFLISIHLIIQRSWFKRLYGKVIGNKKTWLIFMGILLLLPLSFVYKSFTSKRSLLFNNSSQSLKQLVAVEIRQYKGENLSSIEDFHENSIEGPQKVDISKYQLEITGLVDNPSQLTYEEVLNLPAYTKVVTLNCVEGWNAKILWEGILIEDILKTAGVKNEANTVIFYAYDGYTSSLSLDFIKDRNILLAYKMNEVVLPPERGFPFQVVAEDKWGYKWVIY